METFIIALSCVLITLLFMARVTLVVLRIYAQNGKPLIMGGDTFYVISSNHTTMTEKAKKSIGMEMVLLRKRLREQSQEPESDEELVPSSTTEYVKKPTL